MELENQIEEKKLTDILLNKKYPGSLRKLPFFQNLRSQLLDQLKSLDSRLETQLSLTSELSDYFKRKSEIELEFSKMLEKMFKQVNCQHSKGTTVIGQRKESLTMSSPLLSQSYSTGPQQMLNHLILELMNETRKESKERSVLSEICGEIVNRLGFVNEDLQRVFKQCREVCSEGQEELLKVLHELHTSTKSYQNYRLEWKQAESKLKLVESQKSKIESSLGSKEKIDKSKKFKVVEKEVQKRLRKSNDSRFKYLKSKNEYILCLDAANAAVQKYFVEDLSDLIDCMDLGYYESIINALKLFISGEEVKKDSLKNNIENLEKILTSLDSRVDKQKFLEANNSVFVLPKLFKFDCDEKDDENESIETDGFIREELETRLLQLSRRLSTLKMESNELWKTLETAESSLLSLIQQGDHSVIVKDWFVGNSVKEIHNCFTQKMRNDRVEIDSFHIQKYRDYMLVTNRISRLQSKHDHISEVLGIKPEQELNVSPGKSLESSSQVIRRKRIGQNYNNVLRLFGGSIEEWLGINKHEEIPVVIKSAIRVINLYGLHHQGIFRVSGSQLEINNFKDAFERGEDPLAEMNDASDINSVASLLKLYLRELREPLFPIVFFDVFMEVAQLETPTIFISRLRELVTKSLPRSVFVVLRYLFHFLNHLSEYSDENMMDPYNLAICFGPTLVPVPEDKDQVQYQNLVNELIKNIIVYSHEVFVNDGANEVYEKFFDHFDSELPSSEKDELKKVSNSEDDVFTDLEIELPIFNEKSEYMEALAQYDFKARSPRELTFKKGQTLILYSQVSSDWWKGSKKEDAEKLIGLVPDKYILIKIRDEEESSLPSPPIPSCSKSHTTTHIKNSPQILKKRSRTVSETLIRSVSPVQHARSFSMSNNEDLKQIPSCSSIVPLPIAVVTTSVTVSNVTTSNAVTTPSATSIVQARQDCTPDLVMNLPTDNSSDSDSSTSPMENLTGAELFAKQSCTLKKSNAKNVQVVKVKPQVMAKPKMPFSNKVTTATASSSPVPTAEIQNVHAEEDETEKNEK